MKTILLSSAIPEDLKQAGELLKAGELVAVPTETVYGLAADASQPEAVQKIFAAKNRPTNHPLIVHIGSMDMLDRWAINIPEQALMLGERFWPGPLTVILDKHPAVSAVVTGGMSTIGLRMPEHAALRFLMDEFDLALAAPSANPYKQLSPTTATQVYEVMQGKIAAVLDGGPCGVGTESTILKLESDAASILRSGPIKAKELSKVLGLPVACPITHDIAVSGNKKDHYQPHAKLHILSSEAIQEKLSMADAKTGFVLCGAAGQADDSPAILNLPDDHAAYRRCLYDSLYRLDKRQLDQILVEAPPRGEMWLDIWDRLKRAASKG